MVMMFGKWLDTAARENVLVSYRCTDGALVTADSQHPVSTYRRHNSVHHTQPFDISKFEKAFDFTLHGIQSCACQHTVFDSRLKARLTTRTFYHRKPKMPDSSQ
jgi:hypothetical protein